MARSQTLSLTDMFCRTRSLDCVLTTARKKCPFGRRASVGSTNRRRSGMAKFLGISGEVGTAGRCLPGAWRVPGLHRGCVLPVRAGRCFARANGMEFRFCWCRFVGGRTRLLSGRPLMISTFPPLKTLLGYSLEYSLLPALTLLLSTTISRHRNLQARVNAKLQEMRAALLASLCDQKTSDPNLHTLQILLFSWSHSCLFLYCHQC